MIEVIVVNAATINSCFSSRSKALLSGYVSATKNQLLKVETKLPNFNHGDAQQV